MPAFRHGKKNTPEYRAWRNMIERCERPSNTMYKYYGGRGIKVCPKWRRDFVAFLRDMGTRPSPNHSLDRVNCDMGYNARNCRWTDASTQAANRRYCHWHRVEGVWMNRSHLAKAFGLSYWSLRKLLLNGHRIDAAIRRAKRVEEEKR